MRNRNLQPASDYQKLKVWQPTATDVRRAGRCHNCKRDTLLFYGLSEYTKRNRTIGERAAIDGGFYCTTCGFGNAGAMYTEDYEAADVLEE